MTTLYTNWSLYITFTMIYYIRQEYFCKRFSSRSYINQEDIKSVYSQCHVDLIGMY